MNELDERDERVNHAITTELEARLIALATESSWHRGERERVMEEICNPDWSWGRDYWAGCIPEELEKLWPSLSLEAKLVAYTLASELAERNSRAMG
jgi:hypothetical protein